MKIDEFKNKLETLGLIKKEFGYREGLFCALKDNDNNIIFKVRFIYPNKKKDLFCSILLEKTLWDFRIVNVKEYRNKIKITLDRDIKDPLNTSNYTEFCKTHNNIIELNKEYEIIFKKAKIVDINLV